MFPQVVVDWLKSLGSAPANVNGFPENVSVVFRLFLIRITLVTPVLPTVVAANDVAAGVTDTCAIPVPNRPICCGLLPPLSVIARVADLGPNPPGVNVTLTVHDLFIASVLPQVVVVSAKSAALVPVIAMGPMLTVPPALLVSVTVRATLVVPIA